MTNPTTLNAFSTLSPELQQHILGRVGEPATTSKVSRAWQLQTREVVKSELRQVFQHLNPGQPYDLVVDLPAIKEIYRQTLRSVPQNIATHLPLVSFERFLEAENAINTIKIRDTLTFWRDLRGGEDHVNQQHFESLSLADVRSQLSTWIEQNLGVETETHVYLRQSQMTKLPPEIGLLANLSHLYLQQSNQITELPETLENSQILIMFSPDVYEFIRASTAYRIFQLSPEQKNAVYLHIEPSDAQYGKDHVFDSEEKLAEAMRVV